MRTDGQTADPSASDLRAVADAIKRIGTAIGFQQIGITDVELGEAQAHLERWLAKERHGEMRYMAKHGARRAQPATLLPEAVRIISARMDYLPEREPALEAALRDPRRAYIARYALGRDYHKLLRQRLRQLAREIRTLVGEFGCRVCVDSAPLLEKAAAAKAGLGWIGKHTNLINSKAGSWFLLGEILTDLPLPVDVPADNHCGTCRACLDVCPTRAIVAPFELDARRCISYLTIELRGSIPEGLRAAIGNRIFGCDDCQLVCPWNKFASLTREADFLPRAGLDSATLIELFAWTQQRWLAATTGSAIRRAGYEGWLRNIAVALGNAPTAPAVVAALLTREHDSSALVREHVAWALAQHRDA